MTALICFALATLATTGGDDGGLASFLASPVAQRLAALGHQPVAAARVGPSQTLIAIYVPVQGALSDWDDETRLVLYRRTEGADFERVQFVSKAGLSVPGRIDSLLVRDLDHDGQPEVVAVGRALDSGLRTTSLIFRRPSADARYELVWRRRDREVAFFFDARPGQFGYTYVERRTGTARQWEWFGWRDGTPADMAGQASPMSR